MQLISAIDVPSIVSKAEILIHIANDIYSPISHIGEGPLNLCSTYAHHPFLFSSCITADYIRSIIREHAEDK